MTRWFLLLLICCVGASCGQTHAALAEEQSRLSVQARPFSCVALRAPDGADMVALPFAAAMRFALRPAAAQQTREALPAPARAAVLLLYGVPADATLQQLSALSARLKTRFAASLVLLAPTGAVRSARSTGLGALGMRWLTYGKSIAMSSGAVDVHVLPRDDRPHARSLAIVHLKVPYMDVGIAYPAAQQDVVTRVPEEDVLIVDLDQLTADDLSPRTLSMLDPGLAIIVDGAKRLRRQAPLTEFVDRLYEMWIDVYTVDSSAPLIVTADAHGVFLPLHGRHA